MPYFLTCGPMLYSSTLAGAPRWGWRRKSVRALEEEPGRTAVLDVTWPEPVEADHAFYRLPNVILTPHIAGSQEMEVARMGSYMAEALRTFPPAFPIPTITEAVL